MESTSTVSEKPHVAPKEASADPAAPPRDEPPRDALAELRHLAEYRPDPLAALLLVENAGLIELSRRYRQLLAAALQQAESLDDLKQVDPLIKRGLDMERQIERLTQLDLKLEKVMR